MNMKFTSEYQECFEGKYRSKDDAKAYYLYYGVIQEISKEEYEVMYANGDVKPKFEDLPHLES